MHISTSRMSIICIAIYTEFSTGEEFQTISQSPCTALTAGILPAVRAVQGDCQWLLKNNANFHQSHEYNMHCNLYRIQYRWGVSKSIFVQTERTEKNTQSCTIPHRQAYSHWFRTVKQSGVGIFIAEQGSPRIHVIVRRAGLLLSQQDFEWRWSVPLFQCLTVLEFSFILFDLCLLITFFNFIMIYVPIVTFWIFTYHKIWILSIMFCFIWSYWIIYFLACL